MKLVLYQFSLFLILVSSYAYFIPGYQQPQNPFVLQNKFANLENAEDNSSNNQNTYPELTDEEIKTLINRYANVDDQEKQTAESNSDSQTLDLDAQSSNIDSQNSNIDTQNWNNNFQNSEISPENSNIDSQGSNLDTQGTNGDTLTSGTSNLFRSDLDILNSDSDSQNSNSDSKNSNFDFQNTNLGSGNSYSNDKQSNIDSENSNIDTELWKEPEIKEPEVVTERTYLTENTNVEVKPKYSSEKEIPKSKVIVNKIKNWFYRRYKDAKYAGKKIAEASRHAWNKTKQVFKKDEAGHQTYTE